MKFRSLVALLSVFCTSLPAVEYGFLYSYQEEASLILNVGDKLEILMYDGHYQNSTTSYSNFLVAYDFNEKKCTSYRLTSTSLNGPTYYGPLKIVLESSSTTGTGNVYSTVQYRLTRASELEYKNVNIISLPSDTVGAGTHEIVVEASDDLQTWTAVHSSSIGGNKAFFRTRVVTTGPLP